MIELIDELPNNVVGFRARGEVTKADYDNVVKPAVDALVESAGKINFILVVETDPTEFTSNAVLQDIGVGFKHFTQWRKIAIVSDQTLLNKFYDAISAFIPGESKGFTTDQYQEAVNWATS